MKKEQDPNISYLVYYRVPFAQTDDLVVRHSLEEVRFLVHDHNSKVYWAYEVARKKQGETVKKLDLDDLL